ncbi:MAG: tetratricopeptide repeat protein [Vicinamibacteria bacterium]|nr:tetratricopeptide repeat protein [Vicinamibacteria bacterium]
MANPRIEELRKRLEKDPASRLFAQLAEEMRKEGQLEEAIKVCREGLERHPTYPAARMTLGRALLDSGDYASARIEFEQVLKGAPDNGLAHRFLGECLQALGDPTAAAASYRTALMFAPGDAESAARLEALSGGPAAPASAPVRAPAAPTPGRPMAAPRPTAPTAAQAPAPGSSARPPLPAHPAAPAVPPPPRPAPRPTPAPAPVAARPAAPVAPAAPRPAAVPPPPRPPAVAAEAAVPAPQVAPEPEPVRPVPLAPAEESFEIEAAHEAQARAVTAPPAPAPLESTEGEAEAPAEETEAAPEPPPIKLVDVSEDETFELERPSEARPVAAARVPEPPPAVVAAPAPVAAAGAAEAEFELDMDEGAPVASPEAAAAAQQEPAGSPLASATLAELYLQQGAREQAEAVLKDVLAREPDNERARELSTAVAQDPAAQRRAALERTIGRLEQMLAAVQRARA